MLAATRSHFEAGSWPAEPVGVYVHFPWCLAKCPYCDFLSVARDRASIPGHSYADAVISELSRRASSVEGRRVRSVFFGGGTPSLWEASELGRVLSALRSALDFTADVEVTVECNPTSFDDGVAQQLLDAGVNRVSIGVQGLDARRLAFLGRLHNPQGALCAVRAALAAGVPRVNADLIFGVAEQTPSEAVAEALALAELGLTHLSAYALSVEPATAFGALARQGKAVVASEDSVSDAFSALDEALGRAGFDHYEISNFARDGHVAEHNLGYWNGRDYLGLGCGAWGTLTSVAGRVRYRNTPSAERYLATRGEAVAEVEPIDARTALRERILLGLRLAGGVDLDQAGRELGLDPWTAERTNTVERLVAAHRIERRGGRLVIPRSAWLLADGTISELL